MKTPPKLEGQKLTLVNFLLILIWIHYWYHFIIYHSRLDTSIIVKYLRIIISYSRNILNAYSLLSHIKCVLSPLTEVVGHTN